MTEGSQLHQIRAEVKEYILTEILTGAEADEIDETTPLISAGILDSISTVKLVSFLESRYGVQFRAHEMDADYLDTLALIADTVRAKTSA